MTSQRKKNERINLKNHDIQRLSVSEKHTNMELILDYPQMKLYGFDNTGSNKAYAKVICSPAELTVSFTETSRSFTFSTPTHNPLECAAADGLINPEVWIERLMPNSAGRKDECCTYWDSKRLRKDMERTIDVWQRSLDMVEDSKACTDTVLRFNKLVKAVWHLNYENEDDCRRFFRKPRTEGTLFLSDISLDDYLYWDRLFLHALALIERVVQSIQTDVPAALVAEAE